MNKKKYILVLVCSMLLLTILVYQVRFAGNKNDKIDNENQKNDESIIDNENQKDDESIIDNENQKGDGSIVDNENKKDDESNMDNENGNLNKTRIDTWTVKGTIPKNNNFSAWVKKEDGDWIPLDVLTVQTGEQKANDKPIDTALINFDFVGTIRLKIKYNKEDIKKSEVRPNAFGLAPQKEGSDTLIYTLTQNDKNPLKFVVMINNSWDLGNMHVVTNVPESNPPKKTDKNVYVIKAGDEVPLVLPEGKDTYYFDEGTHQLPYGMWVELDLNQPFDLESFELVPAPQDSWFVTGAQKFIIEGKLNKGDRYKPIYNGMGNTNKDTIRDMLTGKYRYIRLILKGNNSNKNPLSNMINEFRIFSKGSPKNIAKSSAIAGSLNYRFATDDNDGTSFKSGTGYTNWHSGESFYIVEDNTTIYLAKGSVVKGSFSAEFAENIVITGRGIMYGKELLWHRDYAEGRTGAIWLTACNDSVVDGITIVAYPMWTVVMNFNTNPTVKNINIFNCMVNGDGVHFSGSSGGLLENTFIRACDDNFVMYHYGPGEDNTIRNCYFFADNARPILLGMGESMSADIKNISFEQIYMLNARGVWDLEKYNGAIQLWAGPKLNIENISFKNIFIDEFEVPEDSSLFQMKTDSDIGQDSGRIDNIVFENVIYNGSLGRKALISGQGVDSLIKNIIFNNFIINNKKLSEQNKNEYITFRGNYSGIIFE